MGDDTTGSDRMKVYITTDNQPASGTISVPLGGWSQNFNIPANSTFEVTIPTALVMVTTTETIENKAVHVTSDNPVSVYQLNYVQYTSDANIAIPTISLGKRYRVTTYSPSAASPAWTEVSLSELLVVGVYDNTVIKITPKCGTEGGHAPNVPFTVTLNRGEAYQVRSTYTNTYNLTGTLIEIDTTVTDNCKTFAVFAGNKCAFITGDSCCCNHICEEMMPTNTWGRQYITVPLKNRASDVFRIVALKNGTIFTINGGIPQGLNAGGYYEADLSTASFIDSNYPVSVAQFSKSAQTDGNTDSDPFMIMINPLEQTINRIVFNSFVTAIITSYYVNIVTKTANAGLVTLDGTNVGASFTPVASNPAYSTAQLTISQGNHILNSDSGLIANVYGYGWYETYGYIAGATVKNLDISYSVVTANDTLEYYNFDDTICRGTPLTFIATANASITDHYWNFGDGSPVVHGLVAPHTYANAGNFTLTYYYQRNNICGLDSIVWEINVKCCNPPLQTNASTPVCIGNPSTLNEISALNPNATYTWNFGNGTPATGNGQGPHQVVWNVSGPDTAWVYVSEPGCALDSAFAAVVVMPSPTSTFQVAGPVCYGVPTPVTYTGNASPMGVYNWNFSGGTVVSGAGQGPYSVYWNNGGAFNLTLEVTENGCPSATTTVGINIYASPSPDISANPQTALLEEPLISFIDNSTNTSIWSWNFGDPVSGPLNYSMVQSPNHEYSATGAYTVWLVATSPDGCIDSVSLVVNIIEIFAYFIPNSITPDGNTINDVFAPAGKDLDYTLFIYNRWGELISETVNSGWNGTYKGEVVKSDTYVWRLIYSFKGSKKQSAIGHVNVL